MANRIQVLPSILAADVGNLEADFKRCMDSGSDGLHIDIMDGHLVPNLSYGPEIVAMAKRTVEAHLNVHLMVTRPDQLAPAFMEAGADTLLIHIESDCPVEPVLKQIRDRGVRPGIVMNPETSLDAILPVMEFVDQVLFMTVHPGFGGQSFLPEVMPKISDLRSRFPDMELAVDGGINRETAQISVSNGADVLFVGSSLFNAADMADEIERFRRLQPS